MRNEHNEDDYFNPYHVDKVWPDLDPEDTKCMGYITKQVTTEHMTRNGLVSKTTQKIFNCINKPTEIVWNYRFPFPKYLPLCNTCAESLVEKNQIKRKKKANELGTKE